MNYKNQTVSIAYAAKKNDLLPQKPSNYISADIFLNTGCMRKKDVFFRGGLDINKEKEEIKVICETLKDEYGNNRYSNQNISMLMDKVVPENILFVKELLTARTVDNKSRFNLKDIVEILNKVNSENISFANELVKMTDKDNNYRFGTNSILLFLSNAGKTDLQSIKELANIKTKDKTFRFDAMSINFLLKDAKNEKIPLVKELSELTNVDGSFRFDAFDISSFLKKTSRENIQVVKELAYLLDKNNKNRFEAADIACLLDKANSKNLPFVKQLAYLTCKNNEPRFGAYIIREFLEYINQENAFLVKELADLKDNNGENIFRDFEIVWLLQYVKKENLPIIKELVKLKDKDGLVRFNVDDVICLLGAVSQKNLPLFTELSNIKKQYGEERFKASDINNLLPVVTKQNLYLIKELAKDEMLFSKVLALSVSENINLKEVEDKIYSQLELMKKEPEKYVSGYDYNSQDEMISEIKRFFEQKTYSIPIAALILDKDSFNNLFRLRMDKAEDYLKILFDFSVKELIILKKICNSLDSEGKPFTGNKKIELIDLVKAYKDNELPLDRIQEMIDINVVDIELLNFDLFKQIMKKSGMSDFEISQIPAEKMLSWDKKYIHLLSKELNNKNSKYIEGMKDIFKAANLEDDFEKFIHDESNIYGKANKNTKKDFEKLNINYEKWLHLPKEIEVSFSNTDKILKKLMQLGIQLKDDIETLRKNQFIKKIIDKQFSKCIKDGQFIIPQEIITSKFRFLAFAKNIEKQLAGVRTLAESNLNNPERKIKAEKVLKIIERHSQRISTLESIKEKGQEKKRLDLKIKMWDRIPQKDMFQGNYSKCCMGLGDGNVSSMSSHYIMNTAFNLIEIIDNNLGKPIGNALCFFVKGKDGKPIFIIDNVEINKSLKLSEEVMLKIRNSIVEYASRVVDTVSSDDKIPVFLGGAFNRVPLSDLPVYEQSVSFVGDFDCPKIYLDLFSGWVDKEKLTKQVKFYKLK